MMFIGMFFIRHADAQQTAGKVTVDAGIELALPVGDLKEIQSLGIGATAKLGYAVIQDGRITFQTGYINFLGKSIGNSEFEIKTESLGLIPLKLGFQYQFPSGRVYLEPQLGYSIFTGDGSTSAFTYAFNIGYYIQPKLDLSLRYEGATKEGGTLSHMGLRIAYHFH